MSLATRCPACGTIFRVVQDQLKVSEGWVRCGQCHEVFHGIEALFDLDSEPSVAARRAGRGASAPMQSTRGFADERASATIPSVTGATAGAGVPDARPQR
ncbi:MAG TPA: zinc-ribbon domain-containing protein, partial [Burkholderiaceae bacterium]